jgi:hypothetical protein
LQGLIIMPTREKNATTTLQPKATEAIGIARVHLTVAIALAFVIIVLAVLYAWLRAKGNEAHDVLTFLGTAFGLGVGIVTSRQKV